MRVIEANIQTPFLNATVKHIARLTGPFDGELQNNLNELIIGLKQNGTWGDISILCVAHPTQADSLLNLKGHTTNAPDSIAVNSPAFVANKGFTVSGAGSKYISMNVSEANCDKIGIFDAHYMIYPQTENAGLSGTRYLLGAWNASVGNSRTYIGVNGSSGINTATCQSDNTVVASVISDPGVGNRKGFISIATSSNDFREARINDGFQQHTDITPHDGLGTQTMKVGCHSNVSAFSDVQFSAWGVGRDLDAADTLFYNFALDTYMLRRGSLV